MKSNLNIEGNVTFTIHRANGDVDVVERKNRVVLSGIDLLINRFINGSGGALDTLAIGTSTTPTDGLETSLGAQVAVGEVSNIITTLSPPIGGAIQIHGKIRAQAAQTITEIGCFAGTTLFSRAVFATRPISMMPDDYLDIAWVISINSV